MSLGAVAITSFATVQFPYVVVDPLQVRNGHKPKVIGDFAGTGFSSLGAQTAGQGFKLYQYPNWTPHLITSYGNGPGDEDAQVADVNNDGALDIVIGGLNGNTYWLENPLKRGVDPYNSTWNVHQIAFGRPSHDVVVGDINRDGKVDVATESGIYLQGATPDTWIFAGAPNINRSLEGTALANLRNDGYLDVIAPYRNATQLAWFENPLHHGGDPVRDVWAVHIIDANPGFAGDMTIATADFNHDGRLDVAMCPMYNDGTLAWYEAASSDGNTWVKHPIGATSFVHQGSLQALDFDGDGQFDIAFTEQEQSATKRIGIFFNQGSGSGWTLQVLGASGGHNSKAGIVGNDRLPSIWSANHGFYGAPNPLELWRNAGAGGGPGTVATPVITPNGGSFLGLVTVVITSDPGATIYYTTDGSVPTRASTPYSIPVILTSSATVRAFAVKSGFNDSAVASASFNATSGGASIVTNGSFEAGVTGWSFYTNTLGSFTTLPGYSGLSARVVTTTSGANVQLNQSGITLEPNTQYRLTFVARCPTGRAVQVSLFKHTAPYTEYVQPRATFGLTASWQTYAVTFTTFGLLSPVSDARLMFWLAPFAQAGDEYWFDDISIVKI